MGRLFGTDGIRGEVNHYPMTAEMALLVGRAVVRHFRGHGESRPVIVGKDTRLSGDMLENALISGICAEGADALTAGVIPTPGVAALCRQHGALAGVVISASHNPYTDNGIKLFGGDGFKLPENVEAAIEALILDDTLAASADHAPAGTVRALNNASADYVNLLRSALAAGFSLKGRRIILDCANGSASHVAPALFRELGADLITLHNRPDGLNINAGCGSEHLGDLSAAVLKYRADVGLAFDGDADRLIAVDEQGHPATGDHLLAMFSIYYKQNSWLSNNVVVSTVMSNLGLRQALAAGGMEHAVCGVGDRLVMEKMRETGAVIGGEDSGHLIFLDHHTTGDGILTALKLTEVLEASDAPLSELTSVMTVFPQELMAVGVGSKPNLDGIAEIQAAIHAVTEELGDQGRVLVRYSGTQPVCRVMVEGPDAERTRALCRQIADSVKRAIGVQEK